MAQTNTPDLVLSVACHGDTRTWTLDPQGRDSFRIVVCCHEVERIVTPKPRPSFSLLSAIAHAVLPLFALWRVGHQ
jgi:hypothetical protein